VVWQLSFDKKALKKSKALDLSVRKRIKAFMEDRVAIADDPRLLGKALTGDYAGYWRYRVGEYRVICDIQNETITILVIEIGHRREVYR
jgi:mRNA interferase RelE/StbE